MPYLTNDGLRIRYFENGLGKPIVMLHGALGSHRVWDLQFNAFADRYRMIAIDLRGHGDSDKPKEGYTHANMIRDLNSLMDHLKLERAVIMGSSLGGALAQMFCLEHPHRVEALVLVGTLAKPWLGRKTEWVKEHSSASLEEVATSWFSSGAKQEHIKLVFAEGKKVSPYFRLNNLKEMEKYDIRSRLSEIRAPTLIIVGEGDSSCPVSNSEEIRNGIKGSEMHVVPECGHLVMLEQAVQFNKLLESFLRKHQI